MQVHSLRTAYYYNKLHVVNNDQLDPQNLIQQQGHIQGSWFKGFQTLHPLLLGTTELFMKML